MREHSCRVSCLLGGSAWLVWEILAIRWRGLRFIYTSFLGELINLINWLNTVGILVIPSPFFTIRLWNISVCGLRSRGNFWRARSIEIWRKGLFFWLLSVVIAIQTSDCLIWLKTSDLLLRKRNLRFSQLLIMPSLFGSWVFVLWMLKGGSHIWRMKTFRLILFQIKLRSFLSILTLWGIGILSGTTLWLRQASSTWVLIVGPFRLLYTSVSYWARTLIVLTWRPFVILRYLRILLCWTLSVLRLFLWRTNSIGLTGVNHVICLRLTIAGFLLPAESAVHVSKCCSIHLNTLRQTALMLIPLLRCLAYRRISTSVWRYLHGCTMSMLPFLGLLRAIPMTTA